MEFLFKNIPEFAAIVIALVSLGVSFWFGRDAREREFLYKSYSRLGDLAIVIYKNIENVSTWQDNVRAVSSPEEATKLLHKFKVETMDEVTRAKQNIFLHQYALSEEKFAALNRYAKNVSDSFELWDKASRKNQATEENATAYAESLNCFWEQMKEAVEASLTEIAHRLRR